MYPRILQLGRFSLPTYGLLTAIGLVVALNLAMRLARKIDIPAEKIWNLGLYTLLAGLIASRLLMVVTHLNLFRYSPLWLLGLSPTYTPWIPWVSAAIAIAVAWLYIKVEDLPLRDSLDVFAPAITAGLAIQSIGAFLGGANFGAPTHGPLAVSYSNHLSGLWYHVPMNMRLQPVQLYHAGICLLIFASLLFWLPRRTQPGEVAGIWLLTYGLARFYLQFLRGSVSTNGLFTPIQRLAIAAVILSAVLLWRRTPTPSPQPIPPAIS